MNPRPFRFGVQASVPPADTTWSDFARRVEDLGYSALTMPDHFDDQLAPMVALSVAAEATTELRVGALVWDNDYKHPVVMAKELATLDVLSGGRVEIGLGAGWMRTDYDAAGMPYDPPGVRVDRMAEGLAVITGLMSDDALDFDGQHYQVHHNGTPKPVQRPHPPVLIGGGGPRVLRIAAEQAQIVGVNPTLTSGRVDASTIATLTPAAVDDKVAHVRACAGERMAEIEMNVRAFVVNITDDRTAAAEGLAAMFNFPAEEILATPFVLVGPPAALVEDLLARRERWGFSYVIVGGDDIEAFAPVVADLAGR